MAITKTINLNINGSQGLKTLEELKAKSTELSTELETLDITTPEFKNVKTELDAVNSSLKTFGQSSQEASDIATEAFVKTSQAIVGTTGTLLTFAASNDQADKVTAKLAKTLALVDSIEKISQATKAASVFLQDKANEAQAVGVVQTGLLAKAQAFLTTSISTVSTALKNLYTVVLANPFTALIAVVGLAAGALFAFSKSTADVAAEQDKLNESTSKTNELLREQTKAVNDLVIAEAKRKDLRKGTVFGLQTELGQLKDEVQDAKNEKDQLEKDLEKLKKGGGFFGLSEEDLKAIKEKEDKLKETNAKITKLETDQFNKQNELKDTIIDNQTKDLNKQLQLNNLRLETQDDNNSKLLKLQNDYTIKLNEIKAREKKGDKDTALDRQIIQQEYYNGVKALNDQAVKEQEKTTDEFLILYNEQLDIDEKFNKKQKALADKAIKDQVDNFAKRIKNTEDDAKKREELRKKVLDAGVSTSKETFDKLTEEQEKQLKALIDGLNAVSNAVDNFNSILDQAGVDKGSGLRAINTSLSSLLQGFTKIKEDGKITFEEITEESLKALSTISQAVNESIQASIEQNIESIDEAINSIEEKRKQVEDNINESLSKQKDLEAKLSEARVGDREKILKAIDAERAREKQLAKDKVKFAEEERKLEEKKKEEKRKAFIANKAASATQAAIATSVAIITAQAAPPPAGQILAILAGISGALQVASILAQPVPQFRSGGPTRNSRSDSDVAGIVHANEYVISAPIVRSPRFKNTINELEKARLTGSYQSGGFTSPNSNDADNKLERVLQTSIALSERPIVVTVVDINDKQSRYAEVIDAATL